MELNKDVHGNEIRRGDFVQLTMGAMIPDYENAPRVPDRSSTSSPKVSRRASTSAFKKACVS